MKYYFLLGIGILSLIPFGVFAGGISPEEVNFGLSAVDQGLALSNDRSIIEIMLGIIRVALGLLGVIVLGLILYAGFLWMTAAGNDEKIATAKKIMTNAVIGLAIIFSAFAITQFVIRSLSEATGSGSFDDDNSIGGCTTESGCSPTFCSRYPFNSACIDEVFYVKSITPSTDATETDTATYMNNAVVRVIFSKPIASAMRDTAVTVTRDGTTVPVTITGIDGNRILEIRPQTADSRWELGAYTVTVNRSLEDYTGGSLETEDVRGTSYPRTTNMYINRIYQDTQQPEITSFTINGDTYPTALFVGDVLSVSVETTDRQTIPAGQSQPVGGIGVVTIDIRDGNRSIYTYRTGPRVRSGSTGGSSVPFTATYVQTMTPADFSVGKQYRVIVTVQDIDGNSVTESRSIPVYPAQCNNGILDPGEDDIDQGGICGQDVGGVCRTDAECSPYMQCVSGLCTAPPVILDIDPKQAAANNWVTVYGRYFGTDVGTIEFGYPSGGGYTWVPATLPSRAACPAGNIWQPTWVIVEVPGDALPLRDDIALRLTRAGTPSETTSSTDSTLDDRGFSGTFTKDTTERPGLCTVLSQETGLPIGAPREAVTVYGRGFIQNTSELYWGNRPGTITAFRATTLLDAVVPAEFGNGVLGVRIQQGSLVSNGIPFTVRTTQSTLDPEIAYIDPATTTPGSFVTLYGSGFGAPYGSVYLSDTAQGAIACANGTAANGAVCYQLTTTLPTTCGVTWRPDMAIIDVTDLADTTIAPGTYAVVLKTIEGRSTAGTDTLTIVAGAAQPSICKITPSSGPAPLPTGNTLRIIGRNFDTTSARINLIANGGFETAAPAPWNLVQPTGAVGASRVGNTGIYASPTQVYDGVRSVGFTLYEDDITSGSVRQTVTGLTAGEQYELGLYAKRSYTNRPVSLMLSARISGGAVISEQEVAIGAEWTEYTFRFTVPVGVSTVDIVMSPATVLASGELERGMYIDAVILSEVSRSGGTVRFWDIGSDKSQIDTGWLVADDGTIDTQNTVPEILSYSDTEIRTQFPIKLNGLTIPTSEAVPVKVRTVAGLSSNSVTYLANACTADTEVSAGFQCCLSGPEAGTIKPAGYACAGETRSAGYTWRMASGLLPQVPRVVEQCYPETTANPLALPPSPSPSTLWAESGTSACINALVAVEFSVDTIDDATVTADSVRMFRCENGDRRGCDRTTNLATDVQLVGDSTLQIYDASGANALEADTWYTVEIDTSIRAVQTVTVAGRDVVTTQPLLATRPCGAGTAYCFSFKTSAFGERCTMVDAFILPTSKTIQELGPVQNYRGDLLPFQVWATANQACVSLSARNIGWTWDIQDARPVTIAQDLADDTDIQIDTVNATWDDIRTLIALLELPNQPLTLRARTTTVESTTITGSSLLTIALGDPQVTTYWPNCTAACSNATFGVQFNREMLQSDMRTEAVTVYQCTDRVCTAGRTVVPVSIPSEYITSRGFEIVPETGLAPDTWYRVELRNIRTIGGYSMVDDTLVPIAGESIEDFVWGFKTKASFDGCFVDSVDLTPGRYIARSVGERNTFAAAPFGTPDECSPYGQRLNPYDYDWAWSIPLDPSSYQEVVTLTSSSIAAQSAPGCSANCTPLGSDRNRGVSPESNYICGNGVVDPGELCDIGMAGEITIDQNATNYTCTYACQRPGNGGDLCGNGRIDNPQSTAEGRAPLGESCDAGAQNGEPGSGCSDTCTLTGSSATFTGDLAAPFCSIREGVRDGVLDAGESCEIDSAGRLVYRAANGTVQTATVADARLYCSDTCLMPGTSLSQAWCDTKPNRGVGIAGCGNAVSICGNSIVESGEICEIQSRDAATGLSTVRILTDASIATPLAYRDVTIPTVDAERICTPSCVLGSICEYEDIFEDEGVAPRMWCDPRTEEGCTESCTLAGSSFDYTFLSQCRDNRVGTGEYAFCEVAAEAERFTAPTQIATAKGESDTVDPVTQAQQSEIQARTVRFVSPTSSEIMSIPSGDQLMATSSYYLQCGFEEYAPPVVSSDGDSLNFNGCPNSNGGFTSGVATNSCCYLRPQVAMSPTYQPYPELYSVDVCRNTLMEVSFEDVIIEQASVRDAIVLAKQIAYTAADRAAAADGVTLPSCADQGLTDITDMVLGTVGSASEPPVLAMNIFERVWYSIKQFFARLVDTVFAYTTDATRFAISETDGVWCDASIALKTAVLYEPSTDRTTGVSRIRMNLSRLLDGETKYVLLLRSGVDGITDDRGVAIQPTDNTTIYYGIPFETGSEICKIDEVVVTPEEYVFQTPGETHEFVIDTISARGDRVVPIPSVYDWRYTWAPSQSELFVIPSESFVSTSDIGVLAARDIEAQQTAQGRVVVITDTATDVGDQTGNFFTDTTNLYARFCASVWGDPRRSIDLPWRPYQNSRYNFEFWYCADAGSARTTDDDLPLFNTVRATAGLGAGSTIAAVDATDVIDRAFFFNASTAQFNSDVFGIQVFNNVERLSAREWYARRFGGVPSTFQSVTIDGYDAITNGITYYINALNIVYDDEGQVDNIYSNIYQFTINEGAQASTQAVFGQIMETLRFNTNMTDFGYCLVAEETSRRTDTELFNDTLACQSDFDCRTIAGAPREGTSGICSNNRTALFRDLDRISDLNTIQQTLAQSRSSVGLYPALASGTFYPGYSVSRWPSWGRFVGGIPTDPINQWTQCGDPNSTDQQTCWNPGESLYYCPAVSSVYEYKVSTSTDDYRIHAQFEFLNTDDDIVTSLLTDSTKIETSPWCAPNTTSSPFGNTCGDGIVQPGEQCDPVGRQVTRTCTVGGAPGVQAQTCSATCQLQEWTSVTCVPAATCGNSIVESGEQCDAGVNNGVYGSGCAADDPTTPGSDEACTIATAGYCRNGILDQDPATGRYYEFCEEVNSVCVNIIDNEPKIPMFHFVVDVSGSMVTKDNGNSDNRWQIVKQALSDNILPSLQGVPDVGLTLFATTHSTLQPLQPLNDTALTQLQAELNSITNRSNTDNSGPARYQPRTGGSVSLGNQTYLNTALRSTFLPSGSMHPFIDLSNSDRPRYIILIVDGNATEGIDPVTRTLQELYTNYGILTYVISPGERITTFSTWAQAGGTAGLISGELDYLLATSANEIVREFDRQFGCSEYARLQQNSCNLSCQAYGSYCGDSIIQSAQGETCDDGNTTPGDGCNAICEIETSTATPAPTPSGGVCGDGLVQTPNSAGVREACDLGSQNGIAPPTAAYGERRTYCSADCTAVLTVDPAGFCGDGKVQAEEVCDATIDGDIKTRGICRQGSAGDVVSPLLACATNSECGTGNTCWIRPFGVDVAAVCTDVGSYSCTNSCQTLVNDCVSCNLHSTPLADGTRNPAIDRLPTLDLRFFNPLGQHEEDNRTPTNNIFLNPPGLTWKLLGVTDEVGRFVPGDNGVSITRTSNMDNAYYYAQPNYYLESDDQCVAYDIAFVSGTYDATAYTAAMKFPLVVNNERSTLARTFTVSPPLPQNMIRIVVRWENYGTGVSAPTFKGGLYSERINSGNTIVAGAIDAANVCSLQARRTTDNYYVPDGCTPFGSNQIWYSRRVLDYASPRVGNGAQGITVDIRKMSSIGSDKKVAYFVQPDSGVIAPYQRDGKVFVEVFTYRSGQATDAIYTPVYRFALDRANLSSNDIASTWHVFNLKKNGTTMELELLDGTVLPLSGSTISNSTETFIPTTAHGQVKTRFCEVQESADNLGRGTLCNPS